MSHSFNPGDIVELQHPDAGSLGREMDYKNARKVLIISIPEFKATNYAIVIPITTRNNGPQKTDIPLPVGMPVSGYIDPLQIRTIDIVARNGVKVATLGNSVFNEISRRVKMLIA
ncbi:type II toxin-antitoxin system PemK/MazF family toxin [Chitinibacter tainanensis]|uniref:type II toxin-antitoxin system PemK/MazF family toxin n=1 Tax=Chitinibacter tainanensis TaxID=230667 RepID=UPI00041C2778|nr:type II toxin-antitoxin system PemK/MazF family toxin [Chitinibacter tainanensis]